MKLLTLLIASLFWGTLTAPTTPERINALIKEDLAYLTAFYKHRHQHPEISLEEKETAAELAAELRNIGVEVTEGVGGYGIVGMIRNGDGPLILYRTDMDALPMYEKSGLDYASQQEIEYSGVRTGTMHSCGHDMHMTTWLGTARAMMRMKDQWSGTLMLIGQPAEEIGQGARMMLGAGLYERFGVPDFGVGLHCSPTIPAGQVGFGKGFTMANTESIDIKVFGVGAHGASPHMSIDPVVIASMIVMDLQTIVSRNLKPTESAVITVGAIQGGVKHNIIPDEVVLKLTVRTYTEEVRLMVHRRIREIAEGVAMAAGMPEDKLPEVTIPDQFTPANYNDPDLVDRLTASAGKAIGADNVIYAEPQMVGEDFSCYGSTEHGVPTVLFWLGTVPDERMASGDLPGLHSPFYYPDPEPTITTGVAVVCQSLLDLFHGETR
ncbi:MAG: amidohydrolase [Saprospiraceae bacterium]|nr:amidohydrolase [Saprospiraceae bacterium]